MPKSEQGTESEAQAQAQASSPSGRQIEVGDKVYVISDDEHDGRQGSVKSLKGKGVVVEFDRGKPRTAKMPPLNLRPLSARDAPLSMGVAGFVARGKETWPVIFDWTILCLLASQFALIMVLAFKRPPLREYVAPCVLILLTVWFYDYCAPIDSTLRDWLCLVRAPQNEHIPPPAAPRGPGGKAKTKQSLTPDFGRQAAKKLSYLGGCFKGQKGL